MTNKGEKNPMFGKKHSSETREKMRIKATGRKCKHKIHANQNDKGRAWRAKVKLAIHTLLGGKCLHCGFSDSRALQIDHINGGGRKEIIQTKVNYQKMVLTSVLNGEKKYQLLCANCNWIKRVEKNEVRKKL